ncbi:MAG TPA: hypothetical protein GX741_02110 [Erysipelothrix sp.]|nr:hypothetical protein [Erysipelothrix sp.]
MSRVIYLSEHSSDGVMSILGMDVVNVKKQTDFKHLVRDLSQKRVSIAFVSEVVYKWFKEDINSYNSDFEVTFIVLPNDTDHQQLGQHRLSELVEDAVGIKVK